MKFRSATPWLLLFGIIATACASGCAGAFRVHPWDRDLLAEKKMSFNPSPVLTSVDDHIYFSKEGSTGGMDVAGGGCGCN